VHNTHSHNSAHTTAHNNTQHNDVHNTNNPASESTNTMATSRTGTGKWKRVRKQAINNAIANEQFNCLECGTHMDYDHSLQPNSAEVDHIVPYALGGKDTIENTRVICRYCNQTRFAREKQKRKHAGRLEPETKIDW